MIIDHGYFTRYSPALPEDHPHVKAKALFCRNAAGRDFYDIAHAAPTGRTFVMVRDGRVVSLSPDPSALFPEQSTLLETDQHVEMGYAYSNGVFGPYVEPVTADKIKAEYRRRVLAVAPLDVQSELAGELAQGRGSPQRKKAHGDMLDWIAGMKTTAKALIAALDPDYKNDAKWPPVPADVRALNDF